MKKSIFAFTILFLILALGSSHAQPFKVGIFTGYGMSSFENFNDNAGTLPFGFQAYYSLEKLQFGSLNFGIEFNYSVAPFTFEIQDNNGTVLGDWKIKQMIIAALVKAKFLKKSKVHPFVRLGAGLYTGGWTFDWNSTAQQAAQQQNVTLATEQDVDSGFGFNIGAGADFDIAKTVTLFGEFLYHIVSRTPSGGQSGGANNWAIQLGAQFGFGN
jgi:opacity protein-like surface antigen